jgi:hypothetical protein
MSGHDVVGLVIGLLVGFAVWAGAYALLVLGGVGVDVALWLSAAAGVVGVVFAYRALGGR